MFDFFVRRESADDHRANSAANYADDFDMIVSDKTGMLVGVAVVKGVHVCWECFDQFIEDPADAKRPVEFNCGGHGVRVLLHSKCVTTAKSFPGDIFHDKVKGHQARRFATKASWPFRSSATKRMVDAAGE